jgi:signal recognition particle subunit SRP14
VVKPDDLEGFFGKYAEVCRTGMTGLKKRDKSKAKRKKKKGGKDKA